MKDVSLQYKTDIAKQIRNNSYVRVYFGNVNVAAISDGQWVSNGEYDFSEVNTLDYKYNYKSTMATLELNRWVLDGSQNIYDSTQTTNDGWISSYISNNQGNFTQAPVLIREFENNHNLVGLTIQFDSRTKEYPTSVTVNVYNQADALIQTVTQAPTDVTVAFELRAENVRKVEIIINSALPYRRPRIEYIMYGIGMTYTNDEIVSCKQSHDIDPISRRLPNEKFEFTILDFEKKYDADNPQGVYEFVETKSPCAISYGYELDDNTIEWLKEDNYLLSGKPKVSNNQATFSATGLVGSLTDTYYKSQLGSKTFYDMALDVLQDANLPLTPDGGTPWVLDEALRNYTTTAVLPIDTHMNCLQLIAHACSCKLYTDDDNKIHITKFDTGELELEDFYVNLSTIMKDSQKFSKISELKKIEVSKTIYTTSQNISTLYEATTEQTELHVEFSSIIDNSSLQIMVNGGSIITQTIYARAVDLELSAGQKTITITGRTISESTEVYTYDYAEQGETDKEENPLITDKTMCDELAENISAYLQLRNTYDVSYRGNPELETGDVISLQTNFSESLPSLILTDEISFNGALQGNLKLKNVDIPYCLAFLSENDFILSTHNSTKNWDGTLYYSTNKKSWNIWNGTAALNSVNGKLYLRGTGNTKITGVAGSSNECWELTGSNIFCVGNIEVLLDYATVANGGHPAMADSCFEYLFHYCDALIKAPDFNAVALSKRCCRCMFIRCTNLTSAPNLSATILEKDCYYQMFYGCTGLISAPELPATSLEENCYQSMFNGCTSLTVAPVLPAMSMAKYCYQSMFSSCTSLQTPPVLPATTLAAGCYYTMFNGCTSLNKLPELPATTLSGTCYYRMFKGCTNIKLSETQTGEYQIAYRMPPSGTGITGNNSFKEMFDSTGGTFTGTPVINTTYYTSNNIV